MKRQHMIDAISAQLDVFSVGNFPLRGIDAPEKRETLAAQILDSKRRIEYIAAIGQGKISPLRANPNSDIFDPLRAAWLHVREGNIDEACWLIFLATHFGKHLKNGWNLCADVYGGLGGEVWTWEKIVAEIGTFHSWYEECYRQMMADGQQRRFGNHRKYESLRPDSNRPLPRVIGSYVAWVGNAGSHEARFAEAEATASSQEGYFDILYRSMKTVVSFGRAGRFDFLTMLIKFGIIDGKPGTLYLNGATGPLDGANLLFYGDTRNAPDYKILDELLAQLSTYMNMGLLEMQILEDALCNWQKSPSRYIYFGG
ncbi:alpha-glutamyl/putrescinyl thymine pyrophosphorylase clade 3 protein [Serratia fonticola]|uniref:Alpha-glutamyl/putrescinyl thymine pyrophosphorylase clade 3 domain-containing protein n=1 Tax=Serratia fonticola TaxID=47917 RepID=A0AAW3WNF0_SERFO|nr:hypothetical protein [Serratia fonticola]MBC3211965.1 hypothetical protein [Serratia fonticola]NYA13526.1 hypothetical protein [Serratia fonticola]NYA33336.1 hypothetical protein [Serratia fonticola]